MIGVGIATTALTPAGKIDMCQFEEALQEMKKINDQLTYRRRARRNRIMTKYVSAAKPEESVNYVTKCLRFFGFGTDVDVVPLAERKIKLVLPPGASVDGAGGQPLQ